MKFGFEDIQKIKQIFRSPAMNRVIRWSRCVHGRILWICVLNTIVVLSSLGMTLVTKELVDAAVSSRAENLLRYGIMLGALLLMQIAIHYALSMIRIRASSKLQRSLQGMLVRDILTKEYASLKGYHSGELVNRVFSDAGVIRSGVLGILPGLLSTLVSFIGAAAILIALDWRFVLLLGIATAVNTLLVGLGLGFRFSLHAELWRLSVPLFVVLFLLCYWGIMLGRRNKPMRERRWLLIAVLFLLIFAVKGAFFGE